MAGKTKTANTQTTEPENAAQEAIEAAGAQAENEEPKGAPEAEQEDPSSMLEDPDDVELAQLMAELKAEGEDDGGEGEEGGEEIPHAEPEADQHEAGQGEQTTDTEQGEAKSSPVPMVPKPRLDEVLDRQRQSEEAQRSAEQQAAYWRGVAEARAKSEPEGGQNAEPQGPTTQDRVAELKASIDKVWEQADAGDVALKDAYSEVRKYEQQIAAIEQESTPRPQPVDQSPQPDQQRDDLYLAERTEQLAQEHPYVTEISDADMGFLRAKAIEALPGLSKGPLADLKLREKMAELSDHYGPLLTGKTLDLPGADNQPEPKTTEKGGLSRAAQDRLKKLETAAQQPPNTGDLSGAGMKDEITEADIMKMSEEDVAALPEATQRRFLSST